MEKEKKKNSKESQVKLNSEEIKVINNLILTLAEIEYMVFINKEDVK